MAEQWVEAAAARKILEESGIAGAGYVLSKRAREGLLQAKARLLTVGKERSEDALVPPGLWWAGGHEALEQNWTTGDFATWIDRRLHMQAFGVTFPLSGILQMLPSDVRSLTARRLSAAGNPGWMSALEALRFVLNATANQYPGRAIMEQARLGFVTGRAVLAQRFKSDDATQLVGDEREWDIPEWFWDKALSMDEVHQNWELGQFNAQFRAAPEVRWIRLSGVHFLTESLQVLLPSAGRLVSVSPAKPPAGGRLAQPWWDDMWCAVWGLIHQGDFKPAHQAEVEKAMLDWASVEGHTISESAVRPKARKLYKAYKGEVRNFLAS